MGGLSLASTLVSFVLGCVSKHVSSHRSLQKKLLLSQQRWDKAEDAFTMELGACLQDGVLTSEEHVKLKGIYEGARDFVDGSLEDECVENNFSSKAKKEKSNNGTGAHHPPDPRCV